VDLFPLIADERRGLADLLEGLDDEQLATASLCAGWTVQTVGGHLTAGWNVSIPRFAFAMVRHRGFDGANDEMAKALGRRPVAEIAADLRDHADHHFTPPGFGAEAPLTDVLLHGLDIRRPLGLPRAIPGDRAGVTLGLLTSKKGRRFGPAKGVDGLSFRDTDLDWSWGDGPEVSGPTDALLLGLGGRAAGLDDLGGDGLAAFRQRFA
jgi:uncharacterized protein (TIGR03083 family)